VEPIASSAAARSIDISTTPGRFVMTPYLEFLEDPSDSLGIDDVQKPEVASRFRPVGNVDRWNLGLTRSAYWVRWSWRNDSQHPVERFFSREFLKEADFYLQSKDGSFEVLNLGSRRPFANQPIANRDIVVPLRLEPGQTQIVYTRLKGLAVVIELQLWQPNVFNSEQKADYIFHALYFGMVLGLAAYNLLLFFVLRKSEYLLYVGYVVTLSLLLATNNGLSREFLWPKDPWPSNYAVEFGMLASMALALQFSRLMLRTAVLLPRFDKVMRALAWGMVLLMAVLPFNAAEINRNSSAILGVGLVSLLAVSTWLMVLGQRMAIFFFAAFSMPIAGTVLLILQNEKVLNGGFLVQNGLQIGSAIEMLVLAFALADRFNTARKEKELAQRNALLAEQEALRVQQQAFEEQQKLVGELQASQTQLAAAVHTAERASNAKSEFLSMVSHELRTPLAGVLGMLNLSLRENLQASLRERLLRAQSSAHMLHSIVNDLLDITLLDTGRLKTHIAPYAVRTVVDELRFSFEERAQEKQLGLQFSIDSQVPAWLLGDAQRIKQILMNVLSNAIKFTERGEVRVSVSCEGMSDSAAQGAPITLRLQVEDTGIGMDEATQSKLFQSFEQGDRSSTRKFEGLGLGLSISQQLAQLMGGRLEVQSTLGVGSAFTLVLPQPLAASPHVDPLPGNPLPVSQATHPQLTGLRVLVAEDVPTNQFIIESLLSEMGHHVTLADNGELCLQALISEPHDLILMDGRMPVMDGLTATRHIRAGSYEGQKIEDTRIPVIALTANVSDKDRANFIDAGADDFLGKPIDEVALNTTLQKVMSQALAHGRMRCEPVQSAKQVTQQADAEALEGMEALDGLEGLDALDALLGDLPDVATLVSETPEPAPLPPPPVIDAKAAKAQALKDKMLAVFKEQVPQRLQEIEAAMAADDWNTAAIVVHGIKGSVAYIWPDSEVYHLAAKMELQADALEKQDFAVGFDQLTKLLRSCLADS
jgi:two-component system sensor histidine kinase/response regulator